MLWPLVLTFAITNPASSQQVPDTTQFFDIVQPAYPAGAGPAVCVDAGHHNFHTLDGRYASFQLAYRDYGAGKVAVSGEAAMFSAQLAGPQRRPVGLNMPEARQNIALLRQLMAWLGE